MAALAEACPLLAGALTLDAMEALFQPVPYGEVRESVLEKISTPENAPIWDMFRSIDPDKQHKVLMVSPISQTHLDRCTYCVQVHRWRGNSTQLCTSAVYGLVSDHSGETNLGHTGNLGRLGLSWCSQPYIELCDNADVMIGACRNGRST